jgi:uncharacterized protein YdhG (YjbR/CyaY superfamily)
MELKSFFIGLFWVESIKRLLVKESVMETNKKDPTTINEYIAQFPQNVQQILEKIRTLIKETAPEAVEKISYAMPGFYLNGMLVWFAGHENYIGFYPTGSGIEAFKKEVSAYKWSKGAVQFPLDQPIPYELIRKMVKFRIAENMKKAEGGGKYRRKGN